jgi:hypothetical protein
VVKWREEYDQWPNIEPVVKWREERVTASGVDQ